MKKAMHMLLLLLIAAAAANLFQTGQTLSELEHSVIRLHILADSDETGAQIQKMLVRDALLASADAWIPAGASYAEGCDAVQDLLPDIQKTAERALRDAGSSDSVQVTFADTAFPARQYGDITLPAGTYKAICVEIGEAKGQNWWCVMYPALCVPAASETVLTDTLDDAACDMAMHPADYELRLKCVDVWRTAVQWVRKKLDA